MAIDKDTSFYIPELSDLSIKYKMYFAFLKIINIIKTITLSKPDVELIAKKNQNINKCKNTLKDLCESL